MMGRSFNDESMVDNGVAELREALKVDPNSMAAHFELGCVMKERAKVEDAIAEFETVLRLDPLHVQAKEEYGELSKTRLHSQAEEGINQARIFKERGMVKNAILEYQNVLRDSPGNEMAWFELGKLFLEQNQADQALEALNKAKELKPEFTDAYLALASAYNIIEQPDNASMELQELLGIDPAHFQGLVMLGEIFQKKGWAEEAVEKFEAAHQANPTQIEPLIQLGVLNTEKQDLDVARKWFQKVIDIDAGNSLASDFFANLSASQKSQDITEAMTRAQEAEKTGDIDAAIMHYDSVIDLDTRNLEARYNLGRLYESKHMYDEATFEFEQALANDSATKFKDVTVRLGDLYIRKGKIVEAVEILKRAKEYFPGNIEIRIQLISQLKFKFMNGFSNADELAEFNAQIRGATDKTQNVSDWVELGLFVSKGLDTTITEEDAINQSIACFEKVLAIDPNSTFALSELAKVYHRKNMLDEVENTFKKILEMDPDSRSIHRKLAELYTQQKRYQEALSEFRQIIELEPANGEYYVKVVDIYKEMYAKDENRGKQYRNVLNEMKAKVEANTKDSMSSFCLGCAFITLCEGFTPSEEEQQWAVYYFKQANAADPNNLWPYWGLKIVYNKQSISGKHMYDEAIAICKKALKIDENNARAHFELGEAYNENYDINMKNEAMTEFKKAIQLDPDFVDAHFRLASIFRVKNMFDKAIEEYNKVIELDPTSTLAKDAKRSLVHIERSRGEA